jgi:hypothetical protein
MSSPTIPAELIDAIVDQVALLTAANNEPGLKKTSTSTLSSCALTSRAFVFPSQKHIFHTIDLARGVYYARFHRLLLLNPYLGTHVRHLKLVGDPEYDFPNGFLGLTHLRTPLSPMLGFLPNLLSFGLTFNLTNTDWNSVPDETWAAFDFVFRMESVKEVELEFVFGFPAALLVSLARLRYLVLSNVDLDADEGIQDHESNSKLRRQVALEGLYLRAVSPGVIKTITKALSNSVDAPPTLRKLALTPMFGEEFAEAVAELITACGSHLTSFAWLPSIYFRESILIECRPRTKVFKVSPSVQSTYPRSTTSALSHFLVTFHNPSSPKKHSPKHWLYYNKSPIATPSKKITLECHYINKSHTSEESPATLWRPLDTALSAMGGSNPVFGYLKEVEIILSVSAIPAPEIRRFVMGQQELLPSVEARGVMVLVRVDKGREESGLLDRLRQM